MSLFQELQKQRDEIIELGARFGAVDIACFGSVAREEEEENSDIDILVTMIPGSGIFKMVGFQLAMEDLLHKKVDVITYKGLSKYIKDRVLKEARPI